MYTSQTVAQVSYLYRMAIAISQRHFQAKEHAESTRYYSHTAIGHLDAIKQSASNLTNNGIKEVSSGNTPRKRKWQYNDEWALTKSRDELLRAAYPSDDVWDILRSFLVFEHYSYIRPVRHVRHSWLCQCFKYQWVRWRLEVF